MTETSQSEDGEQKPKSGKLGLILGLVLALIGGGGAFFAVNTGLILGSGETDPVDHATVDLPPISFVPLEPLTVSVGPGGTRQLRFRGELEVHPERTEDVELLMPRILDVLNGYLRAVDIEVLQEPVALIKIRSHMLHRIKIVTGDGHVRDLLITEFVIT